MADTPRPPKVSKTQPHGATSTTAGAPTGPVPATLPFEEAYSRLEALVNDMERGDLPLEALLAKFEEGVGLVKQCQAFLRQAQLRVEQFVELKDGQWVLKELSAD